MARLFMVVFPCTSPAFRTDRPENPQVSFLHEEKQYHKTFEYSNIIIATICHWAKSRWWRHLQDLL